MPVTTKKVDNILYVKAGSCLLGGISKTTNGFHIRKLGLAGLIKTISSFPTEQECVDHLIDCSRTYAQKLNEHLNPSVPVQAE